MVRHDERPRNLSEVLSDQNKRDAVVRSVRTQLQHDSPAFGHRLRDTPGATHRTAQSHLDGASTYTAQSGARAS